MPAPDAYQTPEPGGGPVHILAVLDSAGDAVKAALAGQPGYRLEMHDANSSACFPWPAGRQPDLILVEPPSADQDRLATWLREVADKAPDLPVLAISGQLPVAAVRVLLSLRSGNAVPLPFTPSGLKAQIAAVMHAPGETETDGARCWSFMSAVGGAGATTLAIETAYQLHMASAIGGRVALVDLNFFDGACAACLDVPANLRLDEAADNPERIDAALIDAFASPHPCGFDVLVAARSLYGFDRINAGAVGRLLDVCCTIYDHVVIDLPRWLQDWSLDVLAGSDAAILVSELTVPALHAARDLAQSLEEEGAENGLHMQIVLNRMAKRVFGHSITVAEAQKALGRKAAGSIGSDWDIAVQAVNYGVPVGHINPKSKISKDVQMLIKTLHQHMLKSGPGTTQRLAS